MMGEFFRALPDAGRELWSFMDGWSGVTVAVVSVVLVALFLGLAQRLRQDHGWLSAVSGGLAVTIVFWWGFGIIPSAWIYFLQGSRAVIAGKIVPNELPGFSNFYSVFVDSGVMIQTGIAVVALAIVAARVQKRYPRSLAEGEESRPQSGGYK